MLIETILWTSQSTLNPFDLVGAVFLGFYVQMAMLAIVTALIFRWQYGDVAPVQQTALSPYEMAYLPASGDRAINLGILKLLESNHLTLQEESTLLSASATIPAQANPLEKAIMQTVAEIEASGDYDRYLTNLYQRIRPSLDFLEKSVQEKSLFLSQGAFNEQQGMTILPIFLVLLLGATRVFIGASQHRPVGYLVGLCMVLAFSLIWILPQTIDRQWVAQDKQPLPQRSRSGHQTLRSLTRQYEWLKQAPGKGEVLLIAVALFGLGILPEDEYAGLRSLFAPSIDTLAALYTNSSGGSGCGGGGCGGGGCGGGCGG